MLDKFDIYDIVTSLVNGIFLLAVALVLFPQCMNILHTADLSEIIMSMMFICIAYFFGQCITAISSMLQPLLYWSWGGQPSELAFKGRVPLRYLPKDLVNHIKNSLCRESVAELSNAALFIKATGIARKANGSLLERHNQMYAYNRVVCVNIIFMTILFVVSCFCGRCQNLCVTTDLFLLGCFAFLFFVHWYRAKQRAFYYVREVFVSAEHELAGGV